MSANIGDIVYFSAQKDGRLVCAMPFNKVMFPHRNSNLKEGFVLIENIISKERYAFVEGKNVVSEKASPEIIERLILESQSFDQLTEIGDGDKIFYSSNGTPDMIILDGDFYPVSISHYAERSFYAHSKEICNPTDVDVIRKRLFGYSAGYFDLLEERKCPKGLETYRDVLGVFNMPEFGTYVFGNPYGMRVKTREVIDTVDYPSEKQLFKVLTIDKYKRLPYEEKKKIVELVKEHNVKVIESGYWKNQLVSLRKRGYTIEQVRAVAQELKYAGIVS